MNVYVEMSFQKGVGFVDFAIGDFVESKWYVLDMV